MGLISSPTSNAIATSTLAITPSLESITLWDLKKGTLTATLADSTNKAAVTALELLGDKLAAGYADGKIRVWSITSMQVLVTFNGHKSAVTSLVFGDQILVSGSRDTDIIVWDLIDEAGLYRLRGHKDAITGLVLLTENNLFHLVSTAKDSLLKVWCLSTQHCIETVIAHKSDVWSLAMHPSQLTLYTAAADQELRVWDINSHILSTKLQDISINTEGVIQSGITLRGIIERTSKERAVTLKVHPSGKFFGIQAADKTVELFKILSQEEIKKKMARKRRRVREKASKAGETVEEQEETKEEALTVADEINSLANIRCASKIRSFDFIPSKQSATTFTLLCALSSNAIEIHSCTTEAEQDPTKLLTTIALAGHRTDIRALALSSDDEVLLSASSSELKLWNIHTQQCIRTISSGYILCAVFAPGNKFVIAGTKTGDLEIYDLGAGVMIDSIKAHDGPVWSIDATPDSLGLTTGSADKDVKMWEFGVVDKQFTLQHTKTLKMTDDVLCVKHSPNGKLLAISLLDCSIKVFYADTLKFFLNLYGHKLPVLCMDISSDSLMIVSAGADKSVRLFGLDFGDCRKSMRGHTDSIMSVKFVWGTHYCFSVSKDKTCRYWDADKCIMTLEGHHGEVWSLAVAKFGRFIITGSADKSIRIWNKTDEQLFLEEERENQLESAYDQQELDHLSRVDQAIGSGVQDADGNYPQAEIDEVSAVAKKSLEGIKSGERILDAIEVWEGEQDTALQYAEILKHTPNALPPPKSPFIIAINPNYTPSQYLLHVILRIRTTELDEALITLPFSKLTHIFTNIHHWLETSQSTHIALRVLFFLLTAHHKQIVATKSLKAVIGDIQSVIGGVVDKGKSVIGFNYAALGYLRREIKERSVVGFGESEPIEEVKSKSKKDKRKRVVIK